MEERKIEKEKEKEKEKNGEWAKEALRKRERSMAKGRKKAWQQGERNKKKS